MQTKWIDVLTVLTQRQSNCSHFHVNVSIEVFFKGSKKCWQECWANSKSSKISRFHPDLQGTRAEWTRPLGARVEVIHPKEVEGHSSPTPPANLPLTPRGHSTLAHLCFSRNSIPPPHYHKHLLGQTACLISQRMLGFCHRSIVTLRTTEVKRLNRCLTFHRLERRANLSTTQCRHIAPILKSAHFC